MASQNINIAESGAVVIAPALTMNQKAYQHGNSQFIPQFPNQYGQPIILTAGQTQTTINLPSDCFNLHDSILTYQVVIPPPSSNTYVWTFADTCAEISHIQFYGKFLP